MNGGLVARDSGKLQLGRLVLDRHLPTHFFNERDDEIKSWIYDSSILAKQGDNADVRLVDSAQTGGDYHHEKDDSQSNQAGNGAAH